MIGEPLISLRGLVYFDKQYDIWCGICLQSGHIVTADSSSMAESMICELLQDECVFLMDKGTLTNFFSNPHAMEMWKRWMYASRAIEPEVKTLYSSADFLITIALISEAKKGGAN